MNKIVTFLRESMVARFFIPAGIILIVFGVFMFAINSKNQNYIKTESTVSSIEVLEEAYTDVDGNYVDATYKITVKYTVDNKEYTTTLDNVSKYNEGDKVIIYYNPKDPSQVTMTISLILPIALIVAGIAALVGGIISGVNSMKKYKKMNEQEKGWNNGK